MAGKPQQRSKNTRQTILLTARRLFDTDGFEETTVEQIALKAGFAKGTIFSHFPDKASLLTAVRIESLEILVEQMDQRARRPIGADLVQTFLNLLKPWLALFANDPDFTQVFLNQAELKGGQSAQRLYEACCTLDKVLEQTTATLLEQNRLPNTASASLYAQGVQAFFYHVLIGLHSGATQNQADQELLLRGLLTRWLSPPN